MKKSALIRIVLWSVVLVLIIAVAVAAFVGNKSGGYEIGIGLGTSYSYSDSGSYLVGDVSVPYEDIKELDISWIAGDIEISLHDGNEIIVKEDSGLDEDERLRYRIKDGKLLIKYRKSGFRYNISRSIKGKKLSILLPKGMELTDLDIEAVSANLAIDAKMNITDVDISNVSGTINIGGVSARRINIENVSGNIELLGIDSERLTVDNVSGRVTLEGKVKDIDFETVSGGMTAKLSEAARSLDIDSVSAKVDITMPNGGGYDVEVDSLSATVTIFGDQLKKNSELKSGNGYTEIEIDTVSGNVTIKE